MKNSLLEIPQTILAHDDGWEYRMTADVDVFTIEHWERGKKMDCYTLPAFCAEQIGSVIVRMAKCAPEE